MSRQVRLFIFSLLMSGVYHGVARGVGVSVELLSAKEFLLGTIVSHNTNGVGGVKQCVVFGSRVDRK